MRKIVGFLAVVCVYVSIASASDHPKRMVTPAQAKALVLASLTAEQKRLPRLGAEQYDDPNSSRFMFFSVTWAGAPNQSVVVGNYAVDPYTGDVWSAVVSCYEESNRDLRALQSRVRAALGLSHSEYMRLKTKGPLCER
jgi:hypothetical protein